MDFTYTISADEVMCTKRAIRNSDLIVIISIPKKISYEFEWISCGLKLKL